MTGTWLLDVNVLIAWLWPAHQAHRAASVWMRLHKSEGWATCPLTQMGFLRIITNPSFSANAPGWSEAVSILRMQTEGGPEHHFWQDSLTVGELDRQLGSRIKGPSQISDAYLLGLAIHNRGRMVTFDYRMSSLAPDSSKEHHALVILRP